LVNRFVFIGVLLTGFAGFVSAGVEPFEGADFTDPVAAGAKATLAGQYTKYPESGDDPGISKIGVSGKTPLWSDADDRVTGQAQGERTHHTQTPAIPGTDLMLPADLYDLQVGVNYRHTLADRQAAGCGATLGSASDAPLGGTDAVKAGVSLFYMHPSREQDAWLFHLSYASDRLQFGKAPLPGVAYLWCPNDQLKALIGFPYTRVRWTSGDGLTATVSVTPAPTVAAAVRYEVTERVALLGAFRSSANAYTLSEDVTEEVPVAAVVPYEKSGQSASDRLITAEERVEAGFAIRLFRDCSLQALGGYAFDRRYFMGDSLGDESSDSRLDFAESPYVTVRLVIPM